MSLDTSAESIAEQLGQGVLSAIVGSRDDSAAEYAEWRLRTPGEVATASASGLAHRINDRFVAHMQRRLDGVAGVEFRETRRGREFIVHDRFVVQCKRHDAQDRIKAFATRSAIERWGGATTLEGLSTINLAAGYRWDKETREIGSPVLSFRRGLRFKPLWVVDLGHQGGQPATPIRVVAPRVPGLPSIDLFGVGQETEEDDRR